MENFLSFHKKYILESVLLIFGVILRIPSLVFEPPFWDESFSWVIAQNSYSGIPGATAHDTHPPLYYELLKLWNSLFGDSIVSMRFLSLVSWFIAMVAIFIIVRKITDSLNKRLLIYGVLTIMPITIWMSTFVRMYMMALALILWAVLSLNKYLETKQNKFLAIFSFLSLAALYTVNISLFAWAGVNIFMLGYFLYKKNFKFKTQILNLFKNKEFIKYIISQIIVFLLYFPWFLVTLKQSTGTITKQIAWIDPFSFKSVLQTPLFLIGISDNSLPGSIIIVGFILLLVISYVVYKSLNLKGKKKLPNLFYILLSLSIISILIILLLSIKQSVLIPRTFFLASIPLVICLIAYFNISKSKKIFTIFLILFLTYGIFLYMDNMGRLKDSFGERNMIEFLEPVNNDNETKLIITRQQAQYPIAYQQIKYLTRSNPKEIKLDKETDTGDYIIYTHDDFVDLESINQNFYYINFTENNKCRSLQNFNITLNVSTEESGRSAQICKYEKIF